MGVVKRLRRQLLPLMLVLVLLLLLGRDMRLVRRPWLLWLRPYTKLLCTQSQRLQTLKQGLHVQQPLKV